jgi:signal peptidase II
MTLFKSNSSFKNMLPWFGLALIILLFDQLTKLLVLQTIAYGQIVPITPFFNLTLLFNKGAAFSFLANESGWQHYFFLSIAIGAALFILIMLKRHAHQRLFSFALALILGGAIGNAIDRVLYGHVVDFLDVYIQQWHWPAFNIADSAICIGAVLLLIDEFRRVNH